MGKDYETARKYYDKAMKIPGAPDIVKRLYAATGFKAMDLKTSWETWLEVYNTAKDERTKKIASKHLYQVKSVLDLGVLREAIKRYQERYQHNPGELSELVQAGFLASVPKDLDGKDYLYDSRAGTVSPPTIWWKR
jgi:hypothetical protein